MSDENHPSDIASGFDAQGNLLKLEGIRAMTWDARSQLQREDGTSNDEVYVYGTGLRLREISVRQAKALAYVTEVKYLPKAGYPHRHREGRGAACGYSAGRAHQRQAAALSVNSQGTPEAQLSYGIDDHPGCSTLELDA
jgi:insecticidal toxin complex protein TccC